MNIMEKTPTSVLYYLKGKIDISQYNKQKLTAAIPVVNIATADGSTCREHSNELFKIYVIYYFR